MSEMDSSVRQLRASVRALQAERRADRYRLAWLSARRRARHARHFEERIQKVRELCDEAEATAAVAIRGTASEGVGFNACVSSFDIRDALDGEF